MAERYQGLQAMAVTTFEKGVQAGMKQGQQQGWRTAILKQLEARFGALSDKARDRFDGLSQQQLEQLTVALLKAHSLRELGLED